MIFKITKKDKNSRARQAFLATKSGGMITPVFLPIGTYGAIKNLSPEELKNLGAQIILSNTYHLWLRPGIDIVKKIGLHKFMSWKGPILTDSGGFQVFSLAKHRKLTEEGVEFKDPLSGEKKFLTPEKSIQIQLDLGSDIILVLDDCPLHPASHEQTKKSMEMSLRWAVRCKEYFAAQMKKEKLLNCGAITRSRATGWKSQKYSSKFKIENLSIESKFKIQNSKLNRPLLFGIVQGSIYKDLRQESAKRIAEMGFDGFAIGGVSVGEPRQYVWKVLEWVMPLLPENKPKHLLGVGKPEEIIKAISYGVDMFDCVIPTREARHGRIYKFKSKNEKLKITIKKAKLFYEILNITNQKFRKDMMQIDENCGCYACKNYSRAYLNHLFKMKELLGYRLATIHNLHFYMQVTGKASKF